MGGHYAALAQWQSSRSVLGGPGFDSLARLQTIMNHKRKKSHWQRPGYVGNAPVDRWAHRSPRAKQDDIQEQWRDVLAGEVNQYEAACMAAMDWDDDPAPTTPSPASRHTPGP